MGLRQNLRSVVVGLTKVDDLSKMFLDLGFFGRPDSNFLRLRLLLGCEEDIMRAASLRGRALFLNFSEARLDEHQGYIILVDLNGEVASAAYHVLDCEVASLADDLLSDVLACVKRKWLFNTLAAAYPRSLDPSKVGNALVRLLASDLLNNQ